MKIVPLLLATAAAAMAPSVKTLSAKDRASLVEELTQWKAKFGGIANAQGLLPPPSNAGGVDDTINDHLQRLMNNKLAVEAARQNNPKATFSTDNKFALMTEAEFAAYVKGSFDESTRLLRSSAQSKLPPTGVAAASIDWTTGSCMPPIRDQGQCGSCWAFSAVGVAEMGHCIATGEFVDLSEQQVTSCCTEGGSRGCMGGRSAHALNYVAINGLCMNSDWPYTSGQSGDTGWCNNNCTKKKLAIGKPVAVQGEAALVTALNVQPATVLVEAGNSVWQNYQGGIVTQCPGAANDHAVIAVGYDGQSYKVRNSWGTNWGEAGYIRLQRNAGGNGMCNVVSEIDFPQLVSTTPVPSSTKTNQSAPTPSTSTSSPNPSRSP
ncbi:Aste57867_3324 [Aphanomyces stellatus]|uniref:Aste57867_3324 protein n=1 Tax=Aphanomyces stellatus TaxID=120398 RepID=A0A485KDA8_9STRA|nr:hypothetical protein As57867_003314 [Aphanomyces stellatus]VFT80494.1 Aste57867_3324 [Aphanomyces stellatus]